jgi:hypothetical protein
LVIEIQVSGSRCQVSDLVSDVVVQFRIDS